MNQREPVRLAQGLALIFDMDGVMIDSNPAHRESWVAFNQRYGIETTDEMLLGMYGKRNDEILRVFFGPHLSQTEIATRGAAKEALYREMIAHRVEEMLVPGLRDFLKELRPIPMAVASNAEPANVDFLLDRARLRSYFRAVVDGHQVNLPKPNPEIYLKAAGLLGITPANCIVFEDSYSGVEAARAAGMRIVGVRTTHGNLPSTSINVDNFASGHLRSWLRVQKTA